MARPNGHTAADVAQAIRDTNGMVSAAARKLGVSRQTVYRYINQYVSVKEAVDDAREQLLDMTESKLFEAVKDGNVTAAMFVLKTVGRNRGYVERQELQHSGPGGKPVQIETIKVKE